MSVLFVAVPVAVLLAIAGVVAFLWAARRGQFDDLETPPLRMLLDDEAAPEAPFRQSVPRAARHGPLDDLETKHQRSFPQ